METAFYEKKTKSFGAKKHVYNLHEHHYPTTRWNLLCKASKFCANNNPLFRNAKKETPELCYFLNVPAASSHIYKKAYQLSETSNQFGDTRINLLQSLRSSVALCFPSFLILWKWIPLQTKQ